MPGPAHGPAFAAANDPGADAWVPLAGCEHRVPGMLRPWLAEPGLLTARVRAACGEATSLRMLRLVAAPLVPHLRARLGVEDAGCLLREVEINCGAIRWVFAQSVFPDSTVERCPWLRALGDNGLGESLSRVTDVRREPFEYLELAPSHGLARAALGNAGTGGPLWARRAIYRVGGRPILVQEVFLPGLGHCG
ncbi:MAG: chorismate lyase [Gammaproteobacteria bacterium]|nr:chorismate lyase [Gammaproteobacteria bacterium]